MSAPEPLTPAEADLQDFPFMPLQVARLRDSDFAAEEDPAACWYAVLLWCASWHQVPAGSLPDSDAVLMKMVGLGRDIRTWKKHRAGALRGFITCSDGRLYHPVVAEQVLSAWDSKLRQRHRTFCATVRKHNERNPSEKRDSPAFDAWMSQGCPANMSEYVPPLSRSEEELSRVTGAEIERDIASKRQGQREGQGQGQGDSKEEDDDDGDERAGERETSIDFPSDLISITDELCRIAGIRHVDPGKIIEHQRLVREWLDEGLDITAHIVPAIREAIAKAPDAIHSLKFFAAPIRQFRARLEAKDHGYRASNHAEGLGNPMVRAVATRRARRADEAGCS